MSGCPICNELSNAMEVKVTGYRVGEYYSIRSCHYCDLQYAENMEVPEGLYEQIYAKASDLPGYSRYVLYQNEVLKQEDPLKWLGQQEPAYWFIRQEISTMPKNVDILEIGSGLGYLSYSIKKDGYNVRGIDLSQEAVDNARKVYGNIYERKDLFKLASESARYDVVILTEVIEHVGAPIEFLTAASALLKPGGKVLLTTPNKSVASLNAYWETENPPVHLWWFSETSIRQMARRSGLTIRFCDFSSMASEGKSIEHKPAVVGFPAWLDQSGNITKEATEWMSRNRPSTSTERLKLLPEPIYRAIRAAYRFLRSVAKAQRTAPASAQRTWQIGAVFQNI